MSDRERFKLPERCPICNRKKTNILLHIKSREECFQQMDKNTFEEWKKMARKETKRKSQTKFNQSGGHNKARKRKAEEEKELSRFRQRKENQKSIVEGKTNRFIRLAGYSLLYLSQGKTPRVYSVRTETFHLIQNDYSVIKNGIYKEKCLLNEEELHSWLSKISSQLLEAVISLQKVVLIPESDWILATEVIAERSGKEDLKDKLFRLIGKLQAYDHENTKNISVPDKYKSVCIASTRWQHYPCFNNNIFTKEDEKMVIKFMEDILGNDLELFNTELQELLKMKEEMENICTALAYTTYDK